MASRNFFGNFNTQRDRTSFNDLVGPAVEPDLTGVRRVPQAGGGGNFIEAGLAALGQSVGIGAKVQAVGKMREDRTRRKFEMKELEREHEKDQQVLECFKTSNDVHPETGALKLDRQKYIN